jgi:hypothetical protein
MAGFYQSGYYVNVRYRMPPHDLGGFFVSAWLALHAGATLGDPFG